MICTTIAVAGTSSEVGKTTLLCSLLPEFPAWEAIKMTRGHYRSCGKDPHACCVSHLLSDEPVIRSGREQTYACGKDTGRYWDAGASNVHWVIVTDDQVERGIRLALERVNSPGVLIEGNSFLRFIDVDFAVIAAGWGDGQIKSSARVAFRKASAIYFFGQSHEAANRRANLVSTRLASAGLNEYLPVYTSEDLPELITRIRHIHSARDSTEKATVQQFGTGGWYV
jgi:molybdopterin-guanine dinucleotide biosynthesis protein